MECGDVGVEKVLLRRASLWCEKEGESEVKDVGLDTVEPL